MRTAGASLVPLACACLVPTAVQRIKRIRDQHIDAKWEELRRVIKERDEALGDVDYWRSQYHGGVDAIIERLRVAVDDDLVLEAMEREFE